MHIPKYFEVTDKTIIESFIKETGLATLITHSEKFPAGTHIPLELEVNAQGKQVLCGHISKANPQGEDFKKNPNVLAIFLSPVSHYISSSWYGHPNAPTWNYLSVHINGKLRVLEGQELWDSVARLTDRYENGQKNPVSLNTLPPSVQAQMQGIIGFEIEIEKLECAFKLSQNRNEEDFRNILKELRLSGELQAKLLADVMEKVRADSK